MILNKIANHNGYDSWDDYKTKASVRAKKFLMPLYIQSIMWDSILQSIKNDNMKLIYREKTDRLLLVKE